MIRGFPIKAGTALALSGIVASLCANPYQSRLDREYKSLSQATARAYSPPPPPPRTSYTPPARSYSSSSAASTLSSSSRSSSSSSSSYSWTPRTESHGQTINRFAAEKRQLEAKAAAAKPNAAENRAKAAASFAAARQQPSHTPAEWARLRADTKGQAPLAAPPRSALESRRAEFAHFAPIARARGASAPWENLRAGQLSLLFQGSGAEPALALAFFSQADPTWPDTQLGLGLCHLRGIGTPPDQAKARDHLERAANYVQSGTSFTRYLSTGELFPDPAFQACRELAVAYDLGQGLPADPLLALVWYEKADRQRITASDRDGLHALRRDFWQRHANRARELMEMEFAANRAGGPGQLAVSSSVLSGLVAAKAAQALFDLGEFVDTKNWKGEETTSGRSGISYFLAAAQLGHEPAARAYFSPAKNGFYNRDLDGDPFWRAHAEFAQAEWPQWEKKFLAAVAAGDATAHIPLAFHYSGARGQKADFDRARHHATLLPAGMPEAQRRAVLGGPEAVAQRGGTNWIDTVWAALGGNSQTVDLLKLRLAADPTRGAALRDEGIALAATDPNTARDRFRDAAALGDLPAQVHLWIYAKRHNLPLGDYSKSLQARLEAVAASDHGALAALTVLMGGGALRLPTGSGRAAAKWHAQVSALAPHKAAFARIAADPSLSDDHAATLRAAALRESELWRAEGKRWGIAETDLIRDLTLADEAVRHSDDLRRQHLAFAAAVHQVIEQLPLWEASIQTSDFDPEADARFLQGLIAWIGLKEDRDIPAAFDALTQGASLGHPLAPLALGYFFGSGHGGFPKNADLARRCRALADARLTALAEDGDGWAQTVLGHMLIEGMPENADHPERPGAYEWLPHDGPRGQRWLRTAALAGHTLPEFFGNSRGQTVAWYLYGGDAERPEAAQWKLIDEIFCSVTENSPTRAVEWSHALAKAREIISEDPATSLARRKLDRALQEADTDAEQSAAHRARAQALLAAGVPKVARVSAGFASRMNALDAAGWRLRAEVEAACGAAEFAAACRGLAQSIAGEAGASGRFAAAFAKINADDQAELRLTIEATLEAHPQTAAFKELKVIIDRIAPSR